MQNLNFLLDIFFLSSPLSLFLKPLVKIKLSNLLAFIVVAVKSSVGNVKE